MMCCICNGTCNHVGPHSYCSAHGGGLFNQPTTLTYTTNWPTTLTDEDIDRIADRVVEKLLSAKKKRRK